MGGEDQAAAAAAFGAYAPWFAPHPGMFGHPGMLMAHPGGKGVCVGGVHYETITFSHIGSVT